MTPPTDYPFAHRLNQFDHLPGRLRLGTSDDRTFHFSQLYRMRVDLGFDRMDLTDIRDYLDSRDRLRQHLSGYGRRRYSSDGFPGRRSTATCQFRIPNLA